MIGITLHCSKERECLTPQRSHHNRMYFPPSFSTNLTITTHTISIRIGKRTAGETRKLRFTIRFGRIMSELVIRRSVGPIRCREAPGLPSSRERSVRPQAFPAGAGSDPIRLHRLEVVRRASHVLEAGERLQSLDHFTH